MKREYSILIAWLVLLVLVAVAAPSFFLPSNVRDVVLSNTPVLIAAIGMTMVILIRQIDISIGAQFAVCGITTGLLAERGVPMIGVAAGAILVGAVLGSANGMLVARVKLPSIVVTLAAMAILRDAVRWITGGAWIQNLPATFQWFGLGQAMGEWCIVATAAVLFAAFAWVLANTAAGRAVYATGSDSEAARLAGIGTSVVAFAVFMLMGAFTGVAALLDSVRFNSIQSNAGIGFELKVIAAVVVGGTSINGGRGSLFGTLLGVAILGTIGPALTFLGVSAFWEKAFQGAIILYAVIMDAALVRVRAYAAAR